MQNTTKQTLNGINPEHFLPNNSNNTNSTDTHITNHNNTETIINSTTTVDTEANNVAVDNNNSPPVRTQNFSFASTYRPPVRISGAAAAVIAGSRFTSSTSPLSILQYKPLPSFTVLNTDDLQTFESRGKPNAIVRPIRRIEPPVVARPTRNPDVATDSPPPAYQAQQQQQHPPLLHNPSNVSMTRQQLQLTAARNGQDEEHFTEELNRKLRNLHYSSNSEAWTKSGHSSNESQLDSLHKRPLFITTVPTGVFLPPAKEPPIPWFLKPRIYAYATHPMVLQDGERVIKDKLRSGTGTTPIAGSDKSQLITKAMRTTAPSNQSNAVRTHSPTRYSVAGSVHLTKEQFQQQLQQRRAKREVEPYKNLMFERRVIRGTNFANVLLRNTDPFSEPEEVRRHYALKRVHVKCRKPRNILGTPPPVAGRRHEVIQTDKYLEELIKHTPDVSVDTQTDLFLEKPPTPPYIPAKVGVDASTEIGDNELFHFEAEAQPIIDILVDACIEQTMLEVAHEQEMEALREKQNEFLARREAELAELRRLEAEEVVLNAEKQRRLRQDKISKELDAELQKNVTAAKLLQGHIASLLPEILDSLEPASDAVKREHLLKTVAPWLTREVSEEVGHIVDSREILTVIIQEIIKERATIYAGYREPEPTPEPSVQYERGEGIMEEQMEECECESIDIDSEDSCAKTLAKMKEEQEKHKC